MADKSINAKDLIDLIVSTKPTAEIENDEDMYVKPLGEIEVGDNGRCSLAVHTDLGSSLDMGDFLVEVGGVAITVSRELDGPGDDYEFDGVEIVYQDGVTEEDVVKAIEENVEFPSYDSVPYDDVDFDPEVVEDSVSVRDGDVFATDEDGNVYCYPDKGSVPGGQTVVEAKEAVHRLVEEWSENDGDTDGMMIESFGPWS